MSVKLTFKNILLLGAMIGLVACQQYAVDKVAHEPNQEQVSIPYEKYTLDNGLTVILHEDKSDPLVHVDVTYHVGSAREEVGKSGFAHFFEHMMFQGSKHVADEQHFRIITEAGGDMNGSTNTDRTNYYQTVPANQLEKVLWLEADRMGFLLEAVDQKKFELQRETVKNERSQRVDNQPYGLRHERTSEALYPPGHPYSWSTIGYVEDLDRVDVNDLKAFFKRWYGPNNAVITIGGDFDKVKVKQLIDKYFSPIPRGPEVSEPAPAPVTLDETRYITLEDKVHLPLLQITYPTVYARHPDEAPLDVLSDILGAGKTSLFYKNLVKAGMAVQAGVSHPCRELACEFQLLALANPASGANLKKLNEVIKRTLAEFEQRGVTADDLQRTKASIEMATVYGLQSVAGKVSTLAANETFEGEPDLVAEDIERYSNVTAEDVMRVYSQYIKGQNAVVLSVVPKEQTQLAVADQNYQMPERKIAPPSPQEDVAPLEITDNFDRSVMPAAGELPTVKVPEYWKATLNNGIEILGVKSSEAPTTTFSLSLEGGMLLDPLDKAGLANMTAMMMNETTKNYSNEQMANQLAKLGSNIQFSAGGRYIQVQVSALTKHLPATLQLLEEKLFNPLFLEADFIRLKEQLLQSKQQQLKTPGYLANRGRDQVLYGKNNRVSLPDEGTIGTIANLTLEDVKAFHSQYWSPAKAEAIAVTNLSQSALMKQLAFLNKWQGDDYSIPPFSDFPEYKNTNLFVINNPGAVQSVIVFAKKGPAFDATGEFFKAKLMNFPLGGAFNSRINLNLREDKGYTYGARSVFRGGKSLGWFEISSDVTAANTADAINEIVTELDAYHRQGMSDEEIAFMRNAFTLSDALKYETPISKVRFVRQLQAFGLDDDYPAQQIEIIKNISKEELNNLAQQHLQLDDMQIIVVGDIEILEEQLNALPYPVQRLPLKH
ncbi:M16 family metallopeptidase [Alteromonas sp. ASW11-130]|uniref:M16 family metallopeptidase n=1 Tax=Alteromonas sp. ASW11-130 TaxID=3015775 RepID=UPI002241F94C|nr:pitrilysin family protein [Alteromonas sp. ASW11-130]MCW8093121.1 insulinase family protein [Alteromonas sp. ASW11-130]